MDRWHARVASILDLLETYHHDRMSQTQLLSRCDLTPKGETILLAIPKYFDQKEKWTEVARAVQAGY